MLYTRDTAVNFESVYNIATDLGGYLITIGILTVIFSTIAIAATIRENVFALRLVRTIQIKLFQIFMNIYIIY